MQEGRELHINGAAIQNEQEPRDINARNTKLAEHDDCNVWTETFGLNVFERYDGMPVVKNI